MKEPKITICLTDVHGMYLTMMALLDKIKKHLNDRPHEVLLLGDGIDRGPNSRRVVEWAMENKIRTVCGNHEDLCLAYSEHAKMGYKAKCSRYYDRDVWLQNGGDAALKSWGTKTLPKDVLDWMSSLPPYIITDEESNGRKLLASHSGYGLDADKGNWMAALWGRHGYDMFDFAHNGKGEPVDDGYYRVFGHTKNTEVQYGPNWANIDTAAAYGGKLSALIWPTGEIISQKCID